MHDIRLKAFTLIELTIALLLVGILSGFAYYVFNTFNGHTQLRQQQKQEQYGLDLLVHQLKVDCAKSDSILYEEEYLYFIDSLGQIIYQFSDSHILRNQYQLRTDSFQIVADEPRVQYVKHKHITTGLVKQVDINLYFRQKTIPLLVQKNYSSTQIIQALTPH